MFAWSLSSHASAVLIVGAVSLLAFRFTLEFVSSMINFGALIAFTVVNLTVLLYFAVHGRSRRHRGRSSPTSSCRSSVCA
jgi:amino acid transporter